jgi:hypothetical protein
MERASNGKAFRMSEGTATNKSPEAQRAERLAAKLRENLRRRKAQARALGESDGAQPLPNSPGEG